MGVDIEFVYSNKNLVASLVYLTLLTPEQAWMLCSVYGPHSLNGKAIFLGTGQQCCGFLC